MKQGNSRCDICHQMRATTYNSTLEKWGCCACLSMALDQEHARRKIAEHENKRREFLESLCDGRC